MNSRRRVVFDYNNLGYFPCRGIVVSPYGDDLQEIWLWNWWSHLNISHLNSEPYLRISSQWVTALLHSSLQCTVIHIVTLLMHMQIMLLRSRSHCVANFKVSTSIYMIWPEDLCSNCMLVATVILVQCLRDIWNMLSHQYVHKSNYARNWPTSVSAGTHFSYWAQVFS